MLLAELCRGWSRIPSRCAGVEVHGLACDSRRVRPGDLFVAIDGPSADGHAFIPDAARAGAAAVVGERRPGAEERVRRLDVPYLRVRDSRAALGHLADAFYGHPSRALRVVGVTGTKGKTTTSWLLDRLLMLAGARSALFGTVENRLASRTFASTNTTPGCLDLHRWLREHADAGGTHAVIEVSSHAISQRRIEAVRFEGGIFTNIAPEHLDYHGSFESYLAVKASFFSSLPPEAFAVLSREERASQRIARAARARILWYGSGAEDGVEEVGASAGRTEFSWRGLFVRTGLIGHHNLLNVLGALTAAEGLGCDPVELARRLEEIDPPPGRLEEVANGAPFKVVVDYAHTDNALEAVLDALRRVTPGRLITVFGCGGDRDRSKRPRMGRVAENASDHVIITSDNPRSECPLAIIEDILGGLVRQDEAVVVEDRREAIGLGIRMARPGDTVLIAGKGHETYQQLGKSTVHFDDREVARHFLKDTILGSTI